MAHYAFLNEDNYVVEVIVGVDENELIDGMDPEKWYESFRGLTCKRTSYHGNIRKNYAGVGFYYDSKRDAFIPPKSFASWVLDEATCRWVAPKPMPEKGNWTWDEESLEWVIAETL